MNNISSDQIIQNFKQVSEKYHEILLYLLEGKTNILPPSFTDMQKLNLFFTESYKQFLNEPEKFLKINTDYAKKFHDLISNSLTKGVSTKDPENEYQDKRFKNLAWQNSIYFNFVKEFYLLSSECVKEYSKGYNFNDELKKYADFQVSQFLSATAPTNFIFANPTVLQETIDTNWQNIVKGLDNLLTDLKNSKDIFTIPSSSNNNFFQKGKNIASSKGKIIFQNELMQLICYEPKNTTYTTPIFLIPPWINKYYILDLSEHNSLVKFLMDNNFQVFMVSWVNPNKTHANIDFEDYLKQGIIEPLEYLQTIGIKKVNALGYCIGGTLLAIALSYFKSKELEYINSATFLTTLLDYTDTGEIGTFINESSISALEKEMNDKGYLDGRYLSNSFNLLRSNDLIWSCFVNNYLLGKPPINFDLLYWNADYTNLPAKMHSYYLRNMYLKNLLKEVDALSMLKTPINLSNIDNPSFFVATSSDHIVPWKSVYTSAKLLKNNPVFCLASSGHVAGIINPPANNKYNYKTNVKISDGADEWLAGSLEHKGSWWNYWLTWLIHHGGSKDMSLNYNKLKHIDQAPGNYCL